MRSFSLISLRCIKRLLKESLKYRTIPKFDATYSRRIGWSTFQKQMNKKDSLPKVTTALNAVISLYLKQLIAICESSLSMREQGRCELRRSRFSENRSPAPESLAYTQGVDIIERHFAALNLQL